MKGWLRRLRGAVGMGVTWAIGWFGLGALLGLVAFGMDASGTLINAFVSGAAGFLGGSVFSVVLSLTEGHRRFDQLSLPRFALWGAVGGGVVAALQMVVLTMIGGAPPLLLFVGIQALIGAGSAAGTLALARKADDQELLQSAEEVADVGLTPEEERRLLGSPQGG